MRALIIGGGIGGLTAAVALTRQGIDAQVYERSPELLGVGAGIALWPNAVKALRTLGLQLEPVSIVSRESAIRRSSGEYLSRIPMVEFERRFAAPSIVLHRADLLALLSSQIAAPHLGKSCTEVLQDTDGVTARFADGTEARGDVLIGCDGLRSVVRAAVGHADPIIYSGYTAWRAVVPFDTASISPAETWGRGQRFGMLPVDAKRVYWFATANAPEGAKDQACGRRQQLLQLFQGWHEPVEALIAAATADENILRNDIYDRNPLPHWGHGRITLLGDAAHPMSPNLGQGGCQAIEDALVLADELASRASSQDLQERLRSYEQRRMSRTAQVVLLSRRVGRMGQWDSPLLCGLRDRFVGLIPQALTLRNMAPLVGYEEHLQGVWRCSPP